MNKKSLYNAIFASGYITLIVFVIDWVTKVQHQPSQDSIFIPITMLSLLVLSVALMAFFFFYHPLVLLLDSKRTESIKSFFCTVITFAGITAIFVATEVFLVS
jgi:hypothetical protein